MTRIKSRMTAQACRSISGGGYAVIPGISVLPPIRSGVMTALRRVAPPCGENSGYCCVDGRARIHRSPAIGMGRSNVLAGLCRGG